MRRGLCPDLSHLHLQIIMNIDLSQSVGCKRTGTAIYACLKPSYPVLFLTK